MYIRKNILETFVTRYLYKNKFTSLTLLSFLLYIFVTIFFGKYIHKHF